VAAGPGQCDEACTVRGHRARSASGSATAGGSPVAPARCGLRREHRREMGSSPGKVREATTHHSGVSMARRRCSEATALRWTATTRDGSCSFKGDEAGWNRRMGGRRWSSPKGGCRRQRRLQTWRWERRSDGGGGQNVTDKSRGRQQLGLGSFPRGVEKSNGGSSHDDLAPELRSATDKAEGKWVEELEAG
jgi:hypothetical protein